jgi:inner membrane protein
LLWRTHFVAGAGLAAVYGAYHSQNDPLVMAISLGIGGFASLLPDIDSPYSVLGRVTRPVSDIFHLAFGHRGILHSFLGLALMTSLVAFLLLFWASPQAVWGFYVPVFAIGYLSHLLLDALSDGGVPLFWPCRGKVSFRLVSTHGSFERFVFLPALTAVITLLIVGMVV